MTDAMTHKMPGNCGEKDEPRLSLRDIAQRLNVSDNFVYQECIRGKLDYYSLGGSQRKRGAIRCSENQYQHYLSLNLSQKRTFVTPDTSAVASITKAPGTVSNKLNEMMTRKKKRKQA